MREVKQYLLEIAGLRQAGLSSTLAHGERWQAGVVLPKAPQLSHDVLEFTPVKERVAFLRLCVRDRFLTFFSAYRSNRSAGYPAFLEALRVLESALTGDSIVLLGGFNASIWTLKRRVQVYILFFFDLVRDFFFNLCIYPYSELVKHTAQSEHTVRWSTLTQSGGLP